MQPDPELILEDAVSIREASELRETLERVQAALSLELSEELDAYQQRHAG